MNIISSSLGALVAVAVAAVAIQTAQAAENLYRQGTPEVLKPAAPGANADQQHAAAVRETFGKAYQSAGSPRLAVFWDRTFGGDAQAPPLLPETDAFKFEAGYSRPFLEAGANFINRNAIVRLAHAAMIGDRQLIEANDLKGHSDVIVQVLKMRGKGFSQAAGNPQIVETEALKGHADLVIQIQMAPSAESAIGVVFRVLVVDVNSGAVKANFFHDAVLRESEQWKAVNGGYIRVAEERELGFEEAARAIALQTMNELMRGWE